MALNIANFAPSGQNSKPGAAPGFFAYHTLDPLATVDTTGYFNAGAANKGLYSILNAGDIIDVVVWTTAIGAGGTVAAYGRLLINSKAAGVLDTTDATVGVVTDTD